MTSLLRERPAAAPDLLGAQRPRLQLVPPAVSSAGTEAVELAAHAGLRLDPWQAWLLDQALGERADGNWAAFEVAVIVSRQNGKGAILEARELFGLFLGGEQLILHSAHEFKTAQEAFRRVLGLIEGTPDLRRRVKSVLRSTNELGVELKSGQRLRFVARSSGSGRGFSGDCVILDEAYNLGADAMEALLPTLSARANPQVWYTSSAGNEQSVQLGRVRARALAAEDEALAFFEWSAGEDDDRNQIDAGDPAVWAAANPALGYRISLDYIRRERDAFGADGGADSFARERLGIGRYPVDESSRWAVIPQAAWTACADVDSTVEDPVAFALDVTPERSWSSIAIAGRRPDGLTHVELVDHRPGTAWVVERMAELVDKWRPCAIVVDPASPAGSLIEDLTDAGVTVRETNARDVAVACGQLFDAAAGPDGATLRHRDQPVLSAAVAGAASRPLGDAWAWSRRGTQVVISPLVAVTLAAWGHAVAGGAIPALHFFADDDQGDEDEDDGEDGEPG